MEIQHWEQRLRFQEGMNTHTVCLIRGNIEKKYSRVVGRGGEQWNYKDRILLENKEINVQYTRLDIVLPEENDEDDTENDVINSAEVVQQVAVKYQV